jgi:hypothetical protein
MMTCEQVPRLPVTPRRVGLKGGGLRWSNFRKYWDKARGAVDLPELHS